MIKKIVKGLTPPIIIGLVRYFTNKVRWSGDYASWQKALDKSKGYNSMDILEKVEKASLAVKNGEALFERDSVLFYDQEYNWPLLTSIFYVSSNVNKMHVTDFGGALGSTYYQYIKLLQQISTLKWAIVEQDNYVEIGIKQFSSNELKFFYSIDECVNNQSPTLLLLSSVLQYLAAPMEFIKNLHSYNYEYICIDRTGFILAEDHRITVQQISPQIYAASYPAWFFNEGKFLDLFLANYEIVFDFAGEDSTNIAGTYYKGFLLKRLQSN